MSVKIINIPLQSETVKPCIKQGDTISKWSATFGASDGIDLTGATIRMQIYWNSRKVIDVSNGNGITIDNPLKLTIDERPHTETTLPVGVGKGDLEITDSNGKRMTIVDVNYTIIEEYTV